MSLDELLTLISTQYEQLFKFQSLLSESGYLGDVVKILFDITANSKELLFNSGIENNNSFICLDNDDEFHDSFPLVNALPSDNECSEKCLSSENISEPEKQKMFKTMLSQLDVRSKNVLKRLQINFLEDFLRLTEEDILAVRNAGAKTTRRILALICQFKNNGEDIIRDNLRENNFYYERKIQELADANFLIPQETEILSDYYSKLDQRSKTILKSNGLVSIKDILLLTVEKILTFKNAGKLTAKRIIKSQRLLLEMLSLQSEKVTILPPVGEVTKAIPLEDQQEIYSNFLQAISKRAKNVLVKNGYKSYDSIRKIDLASIMSLSNAGKITALEIISAVEKLNKNPEIFIEDVSRSQSNLKNDHSKDQFRFSDPFGSIKEWIERRIKNTTHQLMFYHRYGLGFGKVKTLEYVGLLARVSRERARQICVKICRKLTHPVAKNEISSLMFRANEIIQTFRNNIDFDTFLLLLFKDNAAAIELFKHSEPFFAILFPKTFGSKREPLNNQVVIFPKPFIKFVVNTCIQNSLCKTLGENFWLLPIDLLEERMEQNLERARELFPEYTNTRTTTMDW